MTKCTFEIAWVGRCDHEDCQKHKGLKCASCGAPATRECSETFGFVCGSPLCDDCVHYITEEGVNFAGCKHVKKSNQKHTPWYARETA